MTISRRNIIAAGTGLCMVNREAPRWREPPVEIMVAAAR
jgi:hypothetical protein